MGVELVSFFDQVVVLVQVDESIQSGEAVLVGVELACWFYGVWCWWIYLWWVQSNSYSLRQLILINVQPLTLNTGSDVLQLKILDLTLLQNADRPLKRWWIDYFFFDGLVLKDILAETTFLREFALCGVKALAFVNTTSGSVLWLFRWNWWLLLFWIFPCLTFNLLKCLLNLFEISLSCIFLLRIKNINSFIFRFRFLR